MEKLTNVKLSNFDSPFHLPILKLQNSHLKDESPWICSSKIQFTLQKRGFDLHKGEWSLMVNHPLKVSVNGE